MERFDRFHPPDGGKKRQKEVVRVTQLVAAVCDDGKAVVTVADRMVTSRGYSYEPWVSKAFRLTDKAFLMMAGPLETGYAIAQRALWLVSQQPIAGIGHVADVVRTAFQEAHEREVVQRYLMRYGIRSFEHWHEVQGKLPENVAMELRNQIARHRVGVQLMVVGVDAGGGRLYGVSDGQETRPWTRTGYYCVGIGTTHAETTFARYKYDKTFRLREALYVAYEAKRMAEMAPGVGPETDIFIVGPEGIAGLSAESLRDLKKRYNRRVRHQLRKRAQKATDGWAVVTYPISQTAPVDDGSTDSTEGQSP